MTAQPEPDMEAPVVREWEVQQVEPLGEGEIFAAGTDDRIRWAQLPHEHNALVRAFLDLERQKEAAERRLREVLTPIPESEEKGYSLANMERLLNAEEGSAGAKLARIIAAWHFAVADAKGWRCFHCDHIFLNEAEAADHFGKRLGSVASCRDAIAQARAVQRELAEARQREASGWFCSACGRKGGGDYALHRENCTAVAAQEKEQKL